MKQVITFFPDDQYNDLYKTVKGKKIYEEKFGGDSVATKMWIQDGKLMSQMKGELLIKQIKPLSEMASTDEFTAVSGFAKSVEYLHKVKGVPYEIACSFLLDFYNQNGFSKALEMPHQFLDNDFFKQFIKRSDE